MPAVPLSALLAAGPDLGAPSPLLAAKWDPNRRDYASLFEGEDPTDAAVVHSLCVVRGSGAAVLDTGMEPPPPTMLDSLEQEVASAARQALARLVAAGDIRIKRAGLSLRDDGNQLAEGRVEYANLRTGRDATAAFPMSSAPVEV